MSTSFISHVACTILPSLDPTTHALLDVQASAVAGRSTVPPRQAAHLACSAPSRARTPGS